MHDSAMLFAVAYILIDGASNEFRHACAGFSAQCLECVECWRVQVNVDLGFFHGLCPGIKDDACVG